MFSGAGWFERFHEENSQVRYPTSDQLYQYAHDKLSVSEWVSERDRYVDEKNKVPGSWSEMAMFIMESGQLTTPQKNGPTFQVLVNFNIKY